MDFRTLIRTAAERGLVRDPAIWFLYREKRNITAHTYDETKALDVIGHLPGFIETIKELLAACASSTRAS
jgi:nucleotidyltransferase substrate binding protein (TIGR01987 family)